MQHAIYGELARFYHLLDPLEDHKTEGQDSMRWLRGAVPNGQSLLELGAGAGHGAYYLKQHVARMTLADVSAPMLDRSRALNPECEHVQGDMRTLRLARLYDWVLIHDAIAYITTRADLRATLATVAAHLRPGGAALLIPDCLRDSFVESHEVLAGDDADRGLRGISWSYDPDPTDDTHVYDFAFLLREHGEVRAVHDRHVCGLFAEATWLSAIEAAGLAPEVVERGLPDEDVDSGYTDRMFLCRKPLGAPGER